MAGGVQEEFETFIVPEESPLQVPAEVGALVVPPEEHVIALLDDNNVITIGAN